MSTKRFKLYSIDMKYIRDLAHVDDNVPSISPQTGKHTRPFVGIIVVNDNHKYCIPLSSLKDKYSSKKNNIDFMKVLDEKGKVIAGLNFNNMIPVTNSVINPINLKQNTNDSIEKIQEKIFLEKELDWCNKNRDIIIRKSNRLYRLMIENKASDRLKRRCCDFKKLEKVCDKYIQKNSISKSSNSKNSKKNNTSNGMEENNNVKQEIKKGEKNGKADYYKSNNHSQKKQATKRSRRKITTSTDSES